MAHGTSIQIAVFVFIGAFFIPFSAGQQRGETNHQKMHPDYSTAHGAGGACCSFFQERNKGSTRLTPLAKKLLSGWLRWRRS
jgi:hypothetical protein